MGFQKLIAGTTAVTASTSEMYGGTIDAVANRVDVKGWPYFAVRAFTTGTDGTEYFIADIYGWFGDNRKGIVIARETFYPGADSDTKDPFNWGTSGTFIEADHSKWTLGMTRPLRIMRAGAATQANGSYYMLYFPTFGCDFITADLQTASASIGTCLLGAMPVTYLPDWVATCTGVKGTRGATDLDHANGAPFTWDGDQSRIHIRNDTGADMTATPRAVVIGSNPPVLIQDGGSVTLTDQMYSITLKGAASMTQGTQYEVTGWE